MEKKGAQKGMQKHMVLASFRNIKEKGIGTLGGCNAFEPHFLSEKVLF